MKQANVKATHYFREADNVADHQVKQAMNSQKNYSFDSFQHLPARAKQSFWWDNWSSKGPLANDYHETEKNTETLVRHFITNGTWDNAKMQNIL